MNTIILTDIEAEMFKSYMKHHELFVALEMSGALNTQFGKCVINFAHGIPQNVVVEQKVWTKELA